MSHTKFGPDRFSRFDVYWIQTNRQTNKQTNRQTDKPNLYIDFMFVINRINFRNSLLEHLRAITGTTDTVIRTQLCLAMADLILLMPEWKEAVPELMQKLSEPNQILTLLEVLMLLPEEVDSRHLRLGANRLEIRDISS